MFHQASRSILTGIKRHPLQFGGSIFLSYSAIWTVVESTDYFFSDFNLNTKNYFLLMLLVSVVIGIYRTFQPREIRLHLQSTNTEVTITFGDIFTYSGYKAVAVNEFFDSQVGKHVSPNSLHGQVILQCFGGHQETFNALVDKSLVGIPNEKVERVTGREHRYPIGTTAVIPVRDEKYFLVALTRTDIQTLKTSADVPELWTALSGLWNQVRISADGHPVSIPLIGGGLSKIGLTPEHLLQIILLSILNESKKQRFVAPLRIVLSEQLFGEIDLKSLRNEWSHS